MVTDMKVLELFCGTKSFSNVAEADGATVFTSDIRKGFKPSYITNILFFDVRKVPFVPNVVWASVPCTYFSVASMWKHWDKKTYQPKTVFAVIALDIVKKTLEVIEHFHKLNPELLIYIENPRGMLRHTGLLDHLPRHTVTYCQYGEKRMKPTDIWTNDKLWIPRPACKVTDTCHSELTTDMSTAAQRSIVAAELCIEIWESCKNNILPGLTSQENKIPADPQGRQ